MKHSMVNFVHWKMNVMLGWVQTQAFKLSVVSRMHTGMNVHCFLLSRDCCQQICFSLACHEILVIEIFLSMI
jgi:hypothetical protein